MKVGEGLTTIASWAIPGVQAFRDVHDGYPPYQPIAATVGSVVLQVATPLLYESKVAHHETNTRLLGMDISGGLDALKFLVGTVTAVSNPREIPILLAGLGILNVAEQIGVTIRSHHGFNQWRYKNNSLLSAMR